MSHRFALLIALSAVACESRADGADLRPNDFAYGAKVVTSGEAAAYRVSLPLIVYQSVAHADLSDVRVFNGRGELVPSRVERPVSQSKAQVTSTRLPLFTLRGDAAKELDAIRVTIDLGQARVEAQTAAPGLQPATAYILDARTLKEPIAVFDLGWPDKAPDFAGRLRVEASEDLGLWRTVAAAAPIANLLTPDAHIVERRVEIPATLAKFWRLTWVDAPAPFEITSVSSEPARGRVDVERTVLTAVGTRIPNQSGEYEFDLGARVPTDRVTLELPERNTIVEAELLSREAPKDKWRPVVRSGFYRLQSAAGAELTNGPVAIVPTADRHWLARVDNRYTDVGHSVPKLRAGWLPHDIVFLARGSGPFTVAYGSVQALSVASFGEIPTNVAVLNASLAEPETLGGADRLDSRKLPRTLLSKSTVLWAVLAIGVALLAFMAYRLARELKA